MIDTTLLIIGLAVSGALAILYGPFAALILAIGLVAAYIVQRRGW